jgi:glycosyltransferase involved in cell wall biosynthesis
VKVGLVCPLDPGTAISKYVAALAAILAQGHEVTLFCEPGIDPAATHAMPPGVPIVPLDRAGRRLLWRQDVVHVQLGNSQFHHFQSHLAGALRRGGRRPPVVVTLHEATVGNSLQPTCPACIRLVLASPVKLARLTPPALRAMARDRKVLRHLPPRELANHLWAGTVGQLVVHARAVVPLLRFDAGGAPVTVIPPAAIGTAMGPPPGGLPDVLVPVLGLSPHRGLEMLVQAASGVQAPHRLTITGTDSGRHPDFTRRFAALARPLLEAGRLTLPGPLPEAQFEAALERAAVVAVPRLQTLGEVSSAILHAFAAGRPVVASAVGAFPEYVRDGENGLLAANTVPAWTAALERILSSAAERQRMGDGALRTARTELGAARIL